MDSSIVIARAGGAMTFIRSDALAAQVLQASLKEANGCSAPAVDTAKAVLPPPPAEKAEAPLAVKESPGVGVALGSGSTDYTGSKLDMMDMRQKVADFSNALDAMKATGQSFGAIIEIKNQEAGCAGIGQ